MVQIVSGLNPNQRMEAYLAGGNQQLKIQALKRAQEEQGRKHQMEIMKAAAALKKEQAKALADANARAQMGDVQAMQQQNMEAQAANQPPEMKRLQEMSVVLGKIQDPKARAYATEEFKAYEKQLREEEQKQAALVIIKQSTEDGHMDPAEAEARMQAGESPAEIAEEAVKIRQQRAADSVAIQDSEGAIAEVETIFQAVNKNFRGAKLAKNALELFKDSPSSQKKPGAAAMMLKAVKDAIVRGEENVDRPSRAEVQRRLKQPVIAQGGASLEDFRKGMDDTRPDDTFVPGQYAPFKQKMAAEKERRYPGSTAQGGGTPHPKEISALTLQMLEQSEDELDLMKKLKAQGLKLTPQTVAIVGATLQARRNHAAQASGADQE